MKNCENRADSGGLCATHYSRSRHGIPLDRPIRGSTNGCIAVEGCGKPVQREQMCGTHLRRLAKGVPARGVSIETPRCSIFDCERPHVRRGMCDSHCARSMKFGLTAIQLDAIMRTEACAICQRHFGGDLTISIDHDHACCSGPSRSCGKCIRGAICQPCNWAIGCMRDLPEVALAAAAYLAAARSGPGMPI